MPPYPTQPHPKKPKYIHIYIFISEKNIKTNEQTEWISQLNFHHFHSMTNPLELQVFLIHVH